MSAVHEPQDFTAAPASTALTSKAPPSPFLKVLVWDAPTRVCHWLMAASFAGAYLTAGQAGWHAVHQTLGYTMGGLVVFRILWGFVGTRYARFANFVGGPRAVADYLRELPHGWGRRHIGHSPAGALGLFAMWLLTLVVGASGWASDGTRAPDDWRELHEQAAQVMLALVGLHIAAVAFTSWRAGENLLLSMIHGCKLGSASEAIRSACHGVAWLLMAAVLGFWAYQWKSTATAGSVAASPEPPVADVRREPGGKD